MGPRVATALLVVAGGTRLFAFWRSSFIIRNSSLGRLGRVEPPQSSCTEPPEITTPIKLMVNRHELSKVAFGVLAIRRQRVRCQTPTPQVCQ